MHIRTTATDTATATATATPTVTATATATATGKATAAARRGRLLAATLAAGALTLSLTACGGSGSDAGVDKARAAGSAAPAAAGTEAGTGTGTGATEPAGTPGSPAAAPEQGPAEQGGPKTSRVQAMATAEKSVSGGRITNVDLATQDGTRVWEIDLVTAEPRVHNLSVDATTGALLGNRADRMPERARQYLEIPLAKLAAASVDREDAVRTAVAKAGAGFVSELSIQGTEGTPLWQIEVSDGPVRHAIDVDAKTGGVARHQKEENRRDDTAEDSSKGTAKDSGNNGGEGGSGDDRSTGRPSEQEIRDRSGNFGRDYYDWSQHTRH
ncbi:PepSY domain-containing protein [Streptomyces sp. NPDC051563]|uniref:PepSY domain-containing protein n=1 Tax=Streptomyces sp. NPDC051563 TaxID=3365659 RepID=UPI00379560B5